MGEIQVARALRIGEDNCDEETRIIISGKVPELDIEEYRSYYQKQAKMISDVLFKNLPGGTIDHLMATMMARRACLFQVPLFKKKGKKGKNEKE